MAAAFFFLIAATACVALLCVVLGAFALLLGE